MVESYHLCKDKTYRHHGSTRCYWNPRRLQQHLHRSQQSAGGCYEILARHLDPMDPDLQLESEAPDTLAMGHSLPYVQSFGPMLLPTTTVWERRRDRRVGLIDARWQVYGPGR